MKWIKRLLIALAVLALLAFVAIKIASEPLPKGQEGPAAEALTDQTLATLGIDAWNRLPYISWTFFRGQHYYVWDKQNNIADIRWGDVHILFDIDAYEAKITRAGQPIAPPSAEHYELRDKAWTYWINDSYWLAAPFKMRDPGTKRALVQDGDRQGILVTYESGGTTPGDSYLWWIGDDGRPTSYQMWVGILPIKGLKSSWENWQNANGAQIALTHKLGGLSTSLSNFKFGDQPSDVGLDTDLRTAFDRIK